MDEDTPPVVSWPGPLPRPKTHATDFEWTLGEDGVFVAGDRRWWLPRDTPPLEAPLLAATPSRPPLQARPELTDAFAAKAEVGEFYLELTRLDLAHVTAIGEFVAAFGVLGVAHQRFAAFQELPLFPERILPTLAKSWPSSALGQTAHDYELLRGAGASSMLVETIDEFRFGVRVLRDLLTATRVALTSTEDLAPVEWESIPTHELADRPDGFGDWRAGSDLRQQAIDFILRSCLSDSLAPFHPRIEYAGANPFESWRPLPLYSTCCLELFNHFAEHATYRVCANETCHRVYVRQEGRAEHGQHRSTGIKYCSKLCARAQAQRNYRARQHTSDDR